MKKILVVPNKHNLELLLANDKITGLILPLKNLAIQSDIYFNLEEIEEILTKTNKEICININKIIEDSDLDYLKEALIKLNNLNITKIFFYDLAVLKLSLDMNLNKELVVYQEHLNASTLTNKFYKNHGVEYSLITNDITKEEINEISKHQKLMLICYGYLPIFYSRRSLITNYLEYINKDKKDNIYYIKHEEDYYPIIEEETGTCIYTKEKINLINELDNLNIDYLIINTLLTEDNTLDIIINNFYYNKKDNKNYYQGFLNEKTMYKVKENG